MAEPSLKLTIDHKPNQPFGRNIVWRLPVAYIEADLNGTLTFVNQAACELHQLPVEELVGHSIYNFLPADEVAQSKSDYQLAILSGEDPPITRRSIFSLDGNFRSKELHRRLLRDEQQAIVGYCCAIFDVNDTEAIDKETKSEHRWLERVFDAIPNPVIATDSLGFVRFANLAAQKLTGRSQLQMADLPIEQSLVVLSATSEPQRPLNFCAALDAPYSGTVDVTCFGGERTVQLTASPIVDRETGAATGVVVVLSVPDCLHQDSRQGN